MERFAHIVIQIPVGALGHWTYQPLPFRSVQCPSSPESSEDEGSYTSTPPETDWEDETEDEATNEVEFES